jgi:glycosyltransferase involved in cell wall biosynthesis
MSAPLKASSSRNGDKRILQIVESLDTGAVEAWLYRMFTAAAEKYPEYHWTFFCTLGKPGRLDEKVRQLGGDVIYSRHELGEKRAFLGNLRTVIRDGHFDILHCHHDFVSAVYLGASLGIRMRKRIVHIHNTDENILTPNAVKQFLFKEPMRQTCLRLADNIVGISREALACFTHSAEAKPGRDHVVYYGIDTSKFRQPIPTREQFRLDLGLSPNTKVLLFVGRMTGVKNPLFVVEVLAKLAKTDPNAVALFAGAGPLEANVRELAEKHGLSDRVRVLGWRDDTATIMRLSDLLIFPRQEEPKEGLGLVLVESQAAGLPVLASRSITEDVQVIPELFEILPLTDDPHVWAEAALRILSHQKVCQRTTLSRVESSPFGLDQGVSSLMALYNTQ